MQWAIYLIRVILKAILRDTGSNQECIGRYKRDLVVQWLSKREAISYYRGGAQSLAMFVAHICNIYTQLNKDFDKDRQSLCYTGQQITTEVSFKILSKAQLQNFDSLGIFTSDGILIERGSSYKYVGIWIDVPYVFLILLRNSKWRLSLVLEINPASHSL